MDLKLQQRVVIVTGGAKGIGEAITSMLAKEGAIPVIVGRSEKEGNELAQKINENGGKALSIIAELSEKGACKNVIDTTLHELGSIYGLVNNAGVNDGVGLEHGSPEDFQRSVQTNLLHYFELAHFALPALKNSRGSIVNISSKTAITGQGGTSGYAASKGAQLALTREWAVELAPYQIRVNAIVPAEVLTPQYERWIRTFENSDEQLELITSRIPLGKRMTTAEEIASMACFLLSEHSAHTTGQWMVVDGGYVHLDRAFNR